MTILDTLGFGFTECGKEGRVYHPSEIVAVIKDRIVGSGLRTNDIAALAETSPSVISHLKNDGVTPKLAVLEKLLSHFNFKIILASMGTGAKPYLDESGSQCTDGEDIKIWGR